MTENNFKYWAFISYSHQDKAWGQWLHKALETYRVPKRLVGQPMPDQSTIPRRILPVFRDREELPTATDLGDVIGLALQQSRSLIVICSPRAAKSQWVNEEIIAYKRMGRADQIFALIVDGEPNATDKPEVDDDLECFPHALRYAWDDDANALSDRRTEPIAADARPDKDGKSNTKLKLIAGVLSVGFDDLKQRELQRRQRRLITLTSSALTLMLIMTGLTIWALAEKRHAESQTIIAQKRQQEAEQSGYQAMVGLSYINHRDGNAHVARQNLMQCTPYLRNWEWGHLWKSLNRQVGSFHEPGRTKAIAVYPDGSHFLAGGADAIILYERATGNVVKRISVNACTAIAVSSDGSFCITLESDGELIARRALPSMELESQATIIGRSNTPIALTPDDTAIAIGSLDAGVALHDAKTLKVTATLDQVVTQVDCLHFNGDGSKLLAGGREYVAILDGRSLKTKRTLNYRGLALAVTISPDEKMILAAGDRPVIDIWTGDAFDRHNQIPAYAKGQASKHLRLKAMRLIDHRLITVSDFGIVRITNPLTNEDLAVFKGHVAFDLFGNQMITPGKIFSTETVMSLTAADAFVSEIAMNPAGTILASASGDGFVRLWDIQTRQTIGELQHDADVQTVRFSSDGTRIFTTTETGKINVWNVKTAQFQKSKAIGKRALFSVAISLDDSWIVTESDGMLVKLNSTTLEQIDSATISSSRIHAMQLSPDGKVLAVGDGEKIVLRDAATLEVTQELEIKVDEDNIERAFKKDNADIYDIAWNTAGTLLAAAATDGTIELWNTETGKHIGSLKGHTGAVYALTFSNYPNRLISGGDDGFVRIWDVATRQELASLRGHAGSVTAVMPWESNIISADDRGGIRIWPGLSPEAIRNIETAESRDR